MLISMNLFPPTGPTDSRSRARQKLVLISQDRRSRRTLLEVAAPTHKLSQEAHMQQALLAPVARHACMHNRRCAHRSALKCSG